MNIEELKKALKSDEGKELIESLIEDAKKPLLAKNEDLLAKLKKKDETVSEIQTRLEKIESEKSEAETAAATKAGDIEKIKEQLTQKHKKELETLLAEKTTLHNQLHATVVDGGLTEALVKAKVSPALMAAAKALIKTTFKGEIGDADGKPFAKFDGKTAEEFVSGWAQSEQGKAFVLANSNSGGGSNGANGNGNAGTGQKTITRSEFDAMPQNQRMTSMRDGVKVVD